MRYSPHRAPDAAQWLALGEEEKIAAVVAYHRRRRIRFPALQAHAALHVIAENQVAMGDSYIARDVLSRLMEEGLDRHEAIHAIASVLARHFFRTMRDPAGAGGQEGYDRELACLTAESWRRMSDEEAE
jgi:hypothetical protein